jgi:hypothetical protein
MSEVKFLDSSVLIHAYLRPRHGLTQEEKAIKEAAKTIVLRVERGEPVVTTVVHVSEIANIIESRLGLSRSLGFVAGLLNTKNIKILETSRNDYEAAIPVSQEHKVSLNDAMAYLKMKEENIKAIYSFDKHFRNFRDITILP